MSVAPQSVDAVPPLPGRILLCDDDESSRGSLRAVLERAGFSCAACASADEALSILENAGFDLIIADINMPGNEGLEFVQSLSGRESVPPVIVVTGQPSIETATRAVRLRVIAYLLKPVDPDRLVEHAREGIATTRIMRLLRSQRDRLKDSLEEISRCEDLARDVPGKVANTALRTFLNLSVQHSVSTIKDVGDLADAILSVDVNGLAQQRLQGAQPLKLVDAIRETIQVLGQTKHSFKSRELADLRRKLESLMSEGGNS